MSKRPQTKAGRALLTGIQETSDRLDVALNALDYILAIEREAMALVPTDIDVERFETAMETHLATAAKWVEPCRPNCARDIAAAYARLAESPND